MLVIRRGAGQVAVLVFRREPGVGGLGDVRSEFSALAALSARGEVLEQVEKILDAQPLHQFLTSMPAVDVRTEARTITEVMGKDFKTAGHTGLAPATWRSGTSLCRDHSLRKENKVLKRAWFRSAFAALKCNDRGSRAYYDRKRAEGKKHNQAVTALARRHCNVLFARLRVAALYDSTQALPA